METEAWWGLAPEMMIRLVVFRWGWTVSPEVDARRPPTKGLRVNAFISASSPKTGAQRGQRMHLASRAQPAAEAEPEPRPSNAQVRAPRAPCIRLERH